MNWRKIEDRLGNAVRDAVGDLLSSCGDQHLCALALFTADDGMGVSMAANTEEGYQTHLAAEAEDEPNTPEDEAYYRWSSSEWQIEGWRRVAFSEVNAMLAKQDKKDFGAYFDALIEAMTNALKETKDRLGERLAGVTAFVTVTDSDEAEEIENRSATRINDPDLAERFLSRFG